MQAHATARTIDAENPLLRKAQQPSCFLRKCKTQRFLRRRNNETKLLKLFNMWSRPLSSKTHRRCEFGKRNIWERRKQVALNKNEKDIDLFGSQIAFFLHLPKRNLRLAQSPGVQLQIIKKCHLSRGEVLHHADYKNGNFPMIERVFGIFESSIICSLAICDSPRKRKRC